LRCSPDTNPSTTDRATNSRFAIRDNTSGRINRVGALRPTAASPNRISCPCSTYNHHYRLLPPSTFHPPPSTLHPPPYSPDDGSFTVSSNRLIMSFDLIPSDSA